MINAMSYAAYGVEAICTVGGYIPGVNLITASKRITFGNCQVVGGLALAAIYAVAADLTANANRAELKDRAFLALTYAGHGVLNTVRGSIELIPFAGLIFVPYDASRLLGYGFNYNIEQ